MGDILFFQERLKEAETAYRKALDFEADHYDSLYGLACVLSLVNRGDEAKIYFDRVYAMDKICAQKSQSVPAEG